MNRISPRRRSFSRRPSIEAMEERALLSTLHVGSGETYATIQSAVDAAKPGDTIAVDPGTYTEQVTIPSGLDNLTLKSTKRGAAIIQAPSTLSGSDSIVDVQGARGVAITGFTITGPSTGILAGIDVEDGGSATIRQDHVTKIQDNPFSGRQAGIGIYVHGASATIDHDTVDNYQKAGIVVDGTDGTTSAWVTNNTVTGSGPTAVNGQNGIQVSSGASASVLNNTVSGNVYTPQTFVAAGILLSQPGPVVVAGNTATANDVGILALDARSPVISGNTTTKSTFDGIELRGTTTGALVIGNTSRNNQLDGIYVDPTATSNIIVFNRLSNNGNLDAEDLSAGSGTAGTANFWFGNQGKTDNKGGGLLGFHS